ncbi:hypothetical protein [Labrys miyagiensis]|uniref:hypothetical protein n=1 Tax=Labrys miyagiensis TaxID=346912 RepID=UPI0024E06D08|nr:hypothetical protein [Labrys miyagiensis]
MHERDWPFRIINMREIIGESMGLHPDGHYKRLKIMQDTDQIAAECDNLITEHGLDVLEARNVVVNAMLGDCFR